MDTNTEKLINEFMEFLDHSYKYNTSNERINIERKLIDIAESAVKHHTITSVCDSENQSCIYREKKRYM